MKEYILIVIFPFGSSKLLEYFAGFLYLNQCFFFSNSPGLECHSGCLLLGKPKRQCLRKKHREALNTFLSCRGMPIIASSQLLDIYLWLKSKTQTITSTSYTRWNRTCSYTVEFFDSNGRFSLEMCAAMCTSKLHLWPSSIPTSWYLALSLTTKALIWQSTFQRCLEPTTMWQLSWIRSNRFA